MTVRCLAGLTNCSPIQLHFLLVNRQKEHKRPYFFSVKFTLGWKIFTVVSNTVTKQVLMISTLTHSRNENQNLLLMDLHTKVINIGGGQNTDPQSMDYPHGLRTTLKWTMPLEFTGLLIFCDVAISHNWPQIATFRIIRQKSHNSGKIAKFEERTRKYSLLT